MRLIAAALFAIGLGLIGLGWVRAGDPTILMLPAAAVLLAAWGFWLKGRKGPPKGP